MNKPRNFLAMKTKRNNVLYMIVGGIIIIISIAPLVPLVIWSLGSKWFYPSLLPGEFSLRAWEYLASPASQTIAATMQGAVIAILATGMSLLIGVPAGRAFGLHNFRGKTLLFFLMLAPTIIPGLAVGMGIHLTFIRYGLADTRLGVVLVHLIPTIPYVVMVMSGVFSNYNPEYEEQARTLGAGSIQTFIHVTFPAIFPGILVGGLFAFLISWEQYILTVLIGGGRVLTLPLLLFSFASSGNNTITSALSILYLVPTIIILLFTSKHLTGKSVGGF